MTGANRDRGHGVERLACRRWPAERVGDDEEGAEWYDIEFVADVVPEVGSTPIVAAGVKGEVKSCHPDYSDRAGQWWIRRANHERLVDAAGVYVLAVVERGTERVLRMALLDATTIDALIDGAWWEPGDGGHSGVEAYRQVPWTRVFDTLGTRGVGERLRVGAVPPEGSLLAGPFCSSQCYWGSLSDE